MIKVVRNSLVFVGICFLHFACASVAVANFTPHGIFFAGSPTGIALGILGAIALTSKE